MAGHSPNATPHGLGAARQSPQPPRVFAGLLGRVLHLIVEDVVLSGEPISNSKWVVEAQNN